MTYKDINNSVSIKDVLIALGCDVSTRGRMIHCPSIEHEDKHPSAIINDFTSKYSNTCHCFSCQKTFTPISIVMNRNNSSFKEACKWIEETFQLCSDFKEIGNFGAYKENCKVNNFPLSNEQLKLIKLYPYSSFVLDRTSEKIIKTNESFAGENFSIRDLYKNDKSAFFSLVLNKCNEKKEILKNEVNYQSILIDIVNQMKVDSFEVGTNKSCRLKIETDPEAENQAENQKTPQIDKSKAMREVKNNVDKELLEIENIRNIIINEIKETPQMKLYDSSKNPANYMNAPELSLTCKKEVISFLKAHTTGEEFQKLHIRVMEDFNSIFVFQTKEIQKDSFSLPKEITGGILFMFNQVDSKCCAMPVFKDSKDFDADLRSVIENIDEAYNLTNLKTSFPLILTLYNELKELNLDIETDKVKALKLSDVIFDNSYEILLTKSQEFSNKDNMYNQFKLFRGFGQSVLDKKGNSYDHGVIHFSINNNTDDVYVSNDKFLYNGHIYNGADAFLKHIPINQELTICSDFEEIANSEENSETNLEMIER